MSTTAEKKAWMEKRTPNEDGLYFFSHEAHGKTARLVSRRAYGALGCPPARTLGRRRHRVQLVRRLEHASRQAERRQARQLVRLPEPADPEPAAPRPEPAEPYCRDYNTSAEDRRGRRKRRRDGSDT